MFADTLQIWELGGLKAFRVVADALARSPLKFYWMIRVHAQSRTTDERRRFALRDLARALAHPWVVAAGEVTRWPDVHDGAAYLLERLALAQRRGQRVEGHTAGASAERLPALAAGGLTSDHEPITAREVLERARQGIAVMLRESSLRPDLRGLLDAVKEAPGLASRAMLTADGSMPAFIRDHGFVDHLIRVALERGVPPVDAYRMATLNAATYFGRDHEVGGIAPGRYADLCVLEDLSEPRPETVVARGTVAAAGRPADRADPRAGVGPRLHVARRPPHRALEGARERLRPPRARAVPGDASGERGDLEARGAPARRGRSVRGAPRPRRTLDCSRDRGGIRRRPRWSGLDDHHRLQHPRARPPAGFDGVRGEPRSSTCAAASSSSTATGWPSSCPFPSAAS